MKLHKNIKIRIAKEWLILIGSIFAGYVLAVIVYLPGSGYDHDENPYIWFLGPLVVVEFCRSIMWAIKTIRSVEK